MYDLVVFHAPPPLSSLSSLSRLPLEPELAHAEEQGGCDDVLDGNDYVQQRTEM